ncbi:mannosyl-oligosaccharide glucosidase [Anaeramoeba flamelloides]|uniref:Mannosyl-oligosaccharide glucosidase n=1 Tax=Anaeramoeba flamelloides TaxID=1746091 RepID=A0ABQ8YVK2_9EUKA|nr:mannosyl-oligosaccharide glucosidase [Anaeramoeba flamelloides]
MSEADNSPPQNTTENNLNLNTTNNQQTRTQLPRRRRSLPRSINRPRQLNLLDFIIPRAPVYFGLQTKAKTQLMTGFCFHEHLHSHGFFRKIRDVMKSSDKIDYYVPQADSLNYGSVTLVDTYYLNTNITMEYVKPSDRNDAVAIRIKGVSRTDKEYLVSVYSYASVSVNDESGLAEASAEKIQGYNADYKDFQLTSQYQSKLPVTTSYVSAHSDNPYRPSDLVSSHIGKHKHTYQLPNETITAQLPRQENSNTNINFGMIQKVFETPFEWVLYLEPPSNPISKDFDFDTQFDVAHQNFVAKFISTFPHISAANREFAQQTLSSLLFGLSYFRGERMIQFPNKTIVTYHDAELYSFIPNKPSFPRPFFWDEAFHEMLVFRWDYKLFMKIFKSWFDLQVNDGEWTGWIAREQVIGKEAQSRCPEWAWAGQVGTMNPPIFFFTLHDFILEHPSSGLSFLKKVYPQLKKTYDFYYSKCHIKGQPYAFKWPGRTYEGEFGGTLDSGMDDYPRYPQDIDTEVDGDLQSWMALLSSTMRDFAYWSVHTEDYKTYAENYEQTLSYLRSNNWNENMQQYQDSLGNGKFSEHTGYIGVYPLCLKLEPHNTGNNPRIPQMLKLLNDTKKLLHPTAGWRSLSPDDSGFLLSGNYWRGAIWINLNYLCLKGLKYYEDHYPEIKELRSQVRQSIISNMMKEYYKPHGGIFEVYMPLSGKGYFNVPFTGWSSLILLIMEDI